jgi:hypothetical protein
MQLEEIIKLKTDVANSLEQLRKLANYLEISINTDIVSIKNKLYKSLDKRAGNAGVDNSTDT